MQIALYYIWISIILYHSCWQYSQRSKVFVLNICKTYLKCKGERKDTEILSCCVQFRMPSTFWITNPKTIMRNNVAAGSDVSEKKMATQIIFFFWPFFHLSYNVKLFLILLCVYSISMPESGTYFRMSLLELPTELSKPCRRTRQSGLRLQSSPTTSCIPTAWSVSQCRVQ